MDLSSPTEDTSNLKTVSRDSSMESVDDNQSEQKEVEQSSNASSSPTPPISQDAVEEDNYFDPFAIEDNHKKYGQKQTETEPMNIDDEDDDDENNDKDTRSDAVTQSVEQKENEHSLSTDNDPEHTLNDETETVEDQTETEHTEPVQSGVLNRDLFGDEEDDDGDSDEEEEGLDEEEEALRKEMESSWKKEEKEKNKEMTALLAVIRNKHKHSASSSSSTTTKRTNTTKSTTTINKVYGTTLEPKLGRLVDGDTLQIRFDINPQSQSQSTIDSLKSLQPKRVNIAIKEKKPQLQSESTQNRQKMLKLKLREQMHKTRRRQIRRNTKEVDREERDRERERERKREREQKVDLMMNSLESMDTQPLSDEDGDYDGDEVDDTQSVENNENEQNPETRESTVSTVSAHDDSNGVDVVKETENEKMDKMEDEEDSDLDVEATEAALAVAAKKKAVTQQNEDDGDSESEMDEEDMARAMLMAKPTKMSAAVRELVDIAADEEDEDGQIVTEFQDEHEERFGIAKDLLADKADVKLLREHREIYDAKRDRVHRQLMRNEDEKELEMMKKAFVDGEYRAMQRQKQKHNGPALMGGNGGDEDGTERFSMKQNDIDPRNEFDYYLSDNDEKNDFCCYDEQGMPRSVDMIRMRIMEWNRMHSQNRMVLEDDEEAEDAEAVKLRQHRVRRKEMIARSQTMIEAPNHLKIANDRTAAKILDRVRNKKRNKTTASKNGGSTDFGAFLASKGLTAKPLLRRAMSSTFLDHREKCKERVRLNDSKSRNGGVVGSGKVVVFQRKKQKRKRMDGDAGNGGIGMKRRKMMGH